jgi:hypothetical protein
MRLGTSLNHGITCYLDSRCYGDFLWSHKDQRWWFVDVCISVFQKHPKKNPRVPLLVLLRGYLHQYFYQLSYTNDYSFMFDYSNCWSIESPSKVMVQTRWRLSSIQFLLETGLPVAVKKKAWAPGTVATIGAPQWEGSVRNWDLSMIYHDLPIKRLAMYQLEEFSVHELHVHESHYGGHRLCTTFSFCNLYRDDCMSWFFLPGQTL